MRRCIASGCARTSHKAGAGVAQILAAFDQIVMAALTLEVQRIENQKHCPFGWERSGGLCEVRPACETGFPDQRPGAEPDETGGIDRLMPDVPVYSPVLSGVCAAGSRRTRRPDKFHRFTTEQHRGYFPLCADECVRDSRSNVSSGRCCDVRIHTVLDPLTGRR